MDGPEGAQKLQALARGAFADGQDFGNGRQAQWLARGVEQTVDLTNRFWDTKELDDFRKKQRAFELEGGGFYGGSGGSSRHDFS